MLSNCPIKDEPPRNLIIYAMVLVCARIRLYVGWQCVRLSGSGILRRLLVHRSHHLNLITFFPKRNRYAAAAAMAGGRQYAKQNLERLMIEKTRLRRILHRRTA